MKIKLFITATLLAIIALCSGCVVYPAYDDGYGYGPGYYGGGAVVVAPAPLVVYPRYYGYYGYYGYRGYGRGRGRHWR